MNAESIITVSAAVVALTQIVKWAGLPDKTGPIAVVVLSAFGVAVFAVSQPDLPGRLDVWPLFAGTIAVATSAAGVFGFTRAAASAVVSAKAPPAGGAGSDRTV